MKPGDIVKSMDGRDPVEARFVVLEVGIPHVSGTCAKVAPMPHDSVYRLETNLIEVNAPEPAGYERRARKRWAG